MKQLVDVMYEIVDGTPSHYYVFAGDEIEVMRIYVDKICELGYDKTICEDVAEVLSRGNNISLLTQPKCYLVIDDMEYAKVDKNWDSTISKFNNSNDILILLYNKIDKRLKIAKSDYTTIFEKLSDNLLIKYVLKIFPHMNTELVKELVHICENDYGRVLLECDKIKCYAKAKNLITPDNAYEELLEQGAIYKPIGDITFQFVDAVLFGNLESSYELLEQVKLKGENTLGILALLYNNFKNMLLYQGMGADKSNAEHRTGLKYWQINNLRKLVGGYRTTELRNILSVITSIEQGIKLGEIEEALALDYALIKIMG